MDNVAIFSCNDNQPRNVRELVPRSGGGSVVVAEKSTDARVPANGTVGVLRWRVIDELVVESLVVPLTVIVCYELGKRPPQVPLTERDDAIQAFLF